ncbi:glycosyltransferase family 1 protein [Myxosarcina sp. GI1]|uniref:glycosyltransferase family 4 protein n=1 Tax=Myxosarcina sp. GI1 TaxID=1541065 RepID=UPI000568EDAA|nr:glycosyltransferase family 1 protein [Myxosarcina sp. GI1]
MSNSLLINLSFLFDRPTGIATYALNVIPGLQKLNPTLLTAKKFEPFRCISIPNNLTPAQGSSGHLRRLLWTQLKLPQIYRHSNADLIYSPLPEAPLYRNCRYVVMCHDLIPLRFPKLISPLTNYFRYVVPLVLQQAEHIICNSEATARDISDRYGISAKKITPILLGYDRDNFYPRTVTTKNSNRPYFLYLGRQDPYKNLQGLIAAFAKMSDSKEYELWIAGEIDRRFTPQLQQQALELDVSDRIKFLNYVSYQELPFLISGAIALVFPTFWEGFGLPVLEAMACGTPAIASNLASLPEITGEAAILVDPYQTSEITAAMESIVRDTLLRSQLRDLGLQRAKLFSWDKTAAATQESLAKFL